MERESPRWKTRPWRGRQSFACTRCDYATTDRGEIAKHARTRHPLHREPPSPLANIEFASDEAAEAAARVHGLTAAHLLRLPASGKAKSYTVKDVRVAARFLTTHAKE